VKKEELKSNEVNGLTGAVMHEKSMNRHEKACIGRIRKAAVHS
jgi:hypothetical protein